MIFDRRAAYVSNHDGDSVTLLIDQGFGERKLTQDGLRLKDVYAPELSRPGGLETRSFVQNWFIAHQGEDLWPFLVRTDMTKDGSKERTTLGRYLATVWAISGGPSLNDQVNAYVIAQGFERGTGYTP